jgi:hypothetical protein
VLRFKDRSPREWKVPLNIPLGGSELPIGLGVIAALLFSVAGINLLTKQVATVSGVAFTLVFFGIFLTSECINERRRGREHVEVDQFRLSLQEDVSYQALDVRPGNVLCPVRDYNNLAHVGRVLELIDTAKQELVVMTVRVFRGPNTGYKDIHTRELFTAYEQLLFSRVIALAEKAGKPVELLVVPSSDAFQAIAHTAVQLDSAEIVAGRSAVMAPDKQARRLGQDWEKLLDRPRRQVRFRVIEPDGRMHDFYLGAHAPQLSDADINLIHRLWLDLTSQPGKEEAHHRDVVGLALAHLAEDLSGPQRTKLLAEFAVDSPTKQPGQPAATRKRTKRNKTPRDQKRDRR